MKTSKIVVACPDQYEGTDQEGLGLAFHHQGPTFINTNCQAAASLVDQDRGGEIICFGQGNLRSPSASFS